MSNVPIYDQLYCNLSLHFLCRITSQRSRPPSGIPLMSRPLRNFLPSCMHTMAMPAPLPVAVCGCPQENSILYIIQDDQSCKPHHPQPMPPLKSSSDPESVQPSRRRFTSMPHPLPSAIQAHTRLILTMAPCQGHRQSAHHSFYKVRGPQCHDIAIVICGST